MHVLRKNGVITIGLVNFLLILLVMAGCSKPAPVELNVCAGAGLTDVLKGNQ